MSLQQVFMLQIEDGLIWGKGSGSTGCLLNRSLQDQKQFVRMQLEFKVKDIAVSGSFVLCLAQNNQLFFWGSLNDKIIQKPLFICDQVLQIRSGWNHFLFTTKQGLWGMGSNANLELGVQTAAKYVLQPMLLREGSIQKFVCGFRQSYAIIGDSLQGCGESRKYELGVSQKLPQKWIPIWQIKKTNAKVVDMCCGKRFLLILTEDGKVRALGNNQQNVFKQEVTHTIVPTVFFEGIRQIAAGWAHIVLLDSHSRIYTFGRNNLGQLGRSQTETVPVQLQKQQQITKIVSGTEFSFAVTNLGKLFGWGWNEHANISSCGTTVLAVAKLVKSGGKCRQIWTHCATTIIQSESIKL